jgi:hypothetical protein
MRGRFADQGGMLSYISPEARVPQPSFAEDPGAGPGCFGGAEPPPCETLRKRGGPSIPPEQLLSALLLQVFYGIRSERKLMEQLDYIFCNAGSWGFRPMTRSGTRPRSPRTATGCRTVFAKFMARPLNHLQVKPLLSDELFSVDRTLIEADQTVMRKTLGT